MIFINRQVNNHYSMGDTHFLQICYLLLNRNAPLYLDLDPNIKGVQIKGFIIFPTTYFITISTNPPYFHPHLYRLFNQSIF